MSPFRDPETQWDQHRPVGHPRRRESRFQARQITRGEAFGRQDQQKLSDDDSLRMIVQQALDQDKNLASYGLEADVVEGVARVSGIVDTLAEKLHAERVVSQIPGIRGFEDGISISTDGAITDRAVEMEVSEEIAANPQLVEKVGVKVKDGTAFLMGAVDSKREEQLAIETARKARGVTNVVSQLKVGRRTIDPDDLESLFHSQVRNDGDSH